MIGGGLNGQRASNADRSGSSQERLTVSEAQVGSNVSRQLTLEPFPTKGLKTARSGELQRLLAVSNDHRSNLRQPISREGLKRFKFDVQQSASLARDRAQLLQDSILKLDRFRNNVSREQHKNEFKSSDKACASDSLKIGSQMHQSVPDLLSQKLDDWSTKGVLNKRTRSSMAELRGSSAYSVQLEAINTVPGRQSAMTDKDRNAIVDMDKRRILALNEGSLTSEVKMNELSADGDRLEKKLKRKSSVSTMGIRNADSGCDIKQLMQQRSNEQPRSGYHAGLSLRMDGNSQTRGGSSCILPRNDSDNDSLSSPRRNRRGRLYKELTVAKGTNKLISHEPAQLESWSRTAERKIPMDQGAGSAIVMNTPNLFRSSGNISGWEQSTSLNKTQQFTETVDLKRPLPIVSSLLPVQWAGQRPIKISRSRRTNVVSPFLNLDEALPPSQGFTPSEVGATVRNMEASGSGRTNVVSPFINLDEALPPSQGFAPSEVGATVRSMEASGVLISTGMANSTHQNKAKYVNSSWPAAFSESKDSGAPESKSKEKEVDNVEIENGTLNAASKSTSYVISKKTNKLPPKEEIVNGVRKQTRSRRDTVQSKADFSIKKENLDNVETTKPLKNEMPLSDKTESTRQPSPKKISHQEGCARTEQNTNTDSSDLTDKDQKELLAAANAARTASSVASSSAFWKQMESIFARVTSKDLADFKHKILMLGEELEGSSSDIFDHEQSDVGEIACQAIPSPDRCQQASETNVVSLKNSIATPSVNELQPFTMHSQESKNERWFDEVTPLSQRLLSAFITEEESKMFGSCIKHGDEDLRFSGVPSLYGENGFMPCTETFLQNQASAHPCVGAFYNLGQPNPDRKEASAKDSPHTSSYQSQFEHMSLDERILMELQSIDIYPDTMPDLSDGDVDEIEKVLSELKIKLNQEVSKKKNLLSKLEKAIQEEIEDDRRKLEQLALDKLVEMAYKKLKARGGGSRRKGGVGKIAKQLALAFANRTLARCREFEKTGESCFSKPVLRSYIFAEHLLSKNAKDIDGVKRNGTANMHVESRNCSPTSWFSASGAVAPDLSSNLVRHAISHVVDKRLVVPIQGVAVEYDPVSNRERKNGVLLDDVVHIATSRATPTPNSTFHSGMSTLSRDSAQRAELQSLCSSMVEHKTNAKSKQTISQLSTTGHGIGRVKERTSFVAPSTKVSCKASFSGGIKVNQEMEPPSSHSSIHLSKPTEDNIVLQGIDTIDELDVVDGLGGQGQDIASWLDVDEDALKDQDLICLQIPMDDLADLEMKF